MALINVSGVQLNTAALTPLEQVQLASQQASQQAQDVSLLKSSVDDVLSQSSRAADLTGQATAQATTAQGDTLEAGAYGNAIAVANANAATEDVAGAISAIQEQRKALGAAGTILAKSSAGGFTSGGNTMDLLAENMRQMYLGQQQIQTQTELNKGEFLAQGAASLGEQAAATAAASSAQALGTAETQSAQLATSNAAAETAAIDKLIQVQGAVQTQTGQTVGPTQQATQDVVSSVLANPGNTGGVTLPSSETNLINNPQEFVQNTIGTGNPSAAPGSAAAYASTAIQGFQGLSQGSSPVIERFGV